MNCRRVSRIAAAVDPVNRPDEALAAVLGRATTPATIAFIAERWPDLLVADQSCIAVALAGIEGVLKTEAIASADDRWRRNAGSRAVGGRLLAHA